VVCEQAADADRAGVLDPPDWHGGQALHQALGIN
jgi:hypothetical protein